MLTLVCNILKIYGNGRLTMNLDNLKIYIQYIAPKHLITKLVGLLASAKLGKCTTYAVKKFIDIYHINTSELAQKPEEFATFNEFFSRALKKNARPINKQTSSIIFPADGKISQFGDLKANLQMQAKEHYFTIDALLGSEKDAQIFADGKFMTVYLSPRDYHRVHMPFDGQLMKMTYIPGELFSVNPLYTKNIPELFSRNERVVCLFKTDLGMMAVIMVGAAIVRSIQTQWAGIVAPNKSKIIKTFNYSKRNISFRKGDEIGRFMMGSTVICLFEKNKITFDDLKLEDHVLMGSPMGSVAIKSQKRKKSS